MSRSLLVTLPRGIYRYVRQTSLRPATVVRRVATGPKLKNITNLRKWGEVCASNCLGYDVPELTASSSLQMTASDIAGAVKYITHGTYERLGGHVLGWWGDPWGGYTQIRSWQHSHMDQFVANMSQLHSDPAMQRLLTLVDENMDGFSGKEAVETLFSLLLIGYPTDPVTYKLYAFSKANIEQMDIKCLMLMARISDVFPRDDFSLIRMLLARYDAILGERHKIRRNDETVNAFCVFSKMMYRYMSAGLQERFYEYLLGVVTQDTPLHLYSIDTLVNISLVSLNGSAATQKQVISTVKKQLPGRITEFKPYHLMKLSTALQSQSLYDDTTRKIIDGQISALLSQNRDGFGLRETMMMFRALTSKSDRSLVHKIEGLIEKRLRKNDLDDRLTVQLARSLYKVDSTNVDLVRRVQAKVAEYPVAVNLQISSFVTLKEFINLEHKESLVEKLLQSIENDDIHITGEHLRNRCVYVLALMVPLSKQYHTKLLAMIPSWKFEELSLFLYGLTKWPYQEYLVDRRRKNTQTSIHEISALFETVMENLITKIDPMKTQSFHTAVMSVSSLKWAEKRFYLRVLMTRFHAEARGIVDSGASSGASPRRSLGDALRICTMARYFDAGLSNTMCESVLLGGSVGGGSKGGGGGLEQVSSLSSSSSLASKDLDLDTDISTTSSSSSSMSSSSLYPSSTPTSSFSSSLSSSSTISTTTSTSSSTIDPDPTDSSSSPSSSSSSSSLSTPSSSSSSTSSPPNPDPSTLHLLLAYLGVCGHRPSSPTALLRLQSTASHLLSELRRANQLHQYLRTLSNLVASRSATGHELSEVFTTDFLAALNLYLKDNPDLQLSAYEYLAFLNQSAVLDFPELGVPWFLGDIVEKITRVPSHTLFVWEGALRSVLGGSEFYRKCTRSPVGHLMDFEIVVDRNNGVLEYRDHGDLGDSQDSGIFRGRQNHRDRQKSRDRQKYSSRDSTESHRRLAILIEPERFYCMVPENAARRRLGRRQKLVEHLQKLGYGVIALPGHEWPGRRTDYERYLRQKLLSAGVKLRSGAVVTSGGDRGVGARIRELDNDEIAGFR